MKLARLLIDKGADINAEDGWRRTPLHWATENCHTDLVKLLIDKGAEVNAKDDWQQTPLLWAVDAGHTDLAKLLIEKGANVNLGDSGITPIYIAAYHGNTDLTRLLIAKGADVTATDKHGRTPLGMAAAGRYTAIVTLIDEAHHKQGHASQITERRETAADKETGR